MCNVEAHFAHALFKALHDARIHASYVLAYSFDSVKSMLF